MVVKLNTPQIMRQVIYALIPAVLVLFYIYGFSIIIQISLAILTAITTEVIILKIRHKNIRNHINDYSAVLTAILLAISIPTIAPWWIIVTGVMVAIIFAKHLFGGLGNNIFNPAMVGYIFLLISYPIEMISWQNYNIFIDFYHSFDIIFNNIDGLTGATILDATKHNLAFNSKIDASTIINLAYLIGGLYLLIYSAIIKQTIASWHISLSVLIAIIISVFMLDSYQAITLHLFSGATMLCVFFIATDPVSAPANIKGRILYGVIIGFLIIVIRIKGNYPDGVAFAILLANMAAPLIDYYLRKKN